MCQSDTSEFLPKLLREEDLNTGLWVFPPLYYPYVIPLAEEVGTAKNVDGARSNWLEFRVKLAVECGKNSEVGAFKVWLDLILQFLQPMHLTNILRQATTLHAEKEVFKILQVEECLCYFFF